MSRFLFALAVGVAFASTSTVDAQAPTTPATPAVPVVTSAPLMSSYSPVTSSTRRGLFGRLRGRSASTVMSATPAMSGTIITTPTAAPATAVPAPMPKATGGAAVTGNPVVVAGGSTATPSKVVPAGGTTTTPSVVVPAAAATAAMTTAPAMATAPMPSTAKRMGLVARLRARR